MKNLLTLHQAIALALLASENRTLSFSEIAAYIEIKNLFPEREGNITLEKQVMLRTTKSKGKYFYLFEQVGTDIIRLRNLYLLRTEYSILLFGFERIDRQSESQSKAIETRNYTFGSPHDYNFDNSQLDKLSWYAGNRTDEFVNQIITKIERFRKNKDFTRMLHELHEKTRLNTLYKLKIFI